MFFLYSKQVDYLLLKDIFNFTAFVGTFLLGISLFFPLTYTVSLFIASFSCVVHFLPPYMARTLCVLLESCVDVTNFL